MANLVLAVRGSRTKVRQASKLLRRTYGVNASVPSRLRQIATYEVPGDPALTVQAAVEVRQAFKGVSAAPVLWDDIASDYSANALSPKRTKSLLLETRSVRGDLQVKSESDVFKASTEAVSGGLLSTDERSPGDWTTFRLRHRIIPLGLGLNWRRLVFTLGSNSGAMANAARALSRLVRLKAADREQAIGLVRNGKLQADLRSALHRLNDGPWREDILGVGYGLPFDATQPQKLSIKLFTSGNESKEARQPEPLKIKGLGSFPWDVVALGKWRVNKPGGTGKDQPKPLIGTPPCPFPDVAISGDGGKTYGTIGGLIPVVENDSLVHYGVTCEHVVLDQHGGYAKTVDFHRPAWTGAQISVSRLPLGVGDKLDVALLGPFTNPVPDSPPRVLTLPWAEPRVNDRIRYEFYGATSGSQTDTAYSAVFEFPLHTGETAKTVILFRPGFATGGDSGSIIFRQDNGRPLGVILAGTEVNGKYYPVCLPIIDVNDRLCFCAGLVHSNR